MVYKIIRFLVKCLLVAVFRLRVTGLENMPSGGCIVASNHISLWDPPLIGCALPVRRPIHFMAKEELFRIPIFSWVITQLQAFPVRRGAADRNAIRAAIQLLSDGEIVGMFPEGTRSKTGRLGTAQPGLGMLAVKAGVPIIPVALTGSNQVFGKGQIFPQFTVRFGQPLYLASNKTDRENSDYINATIMQEIAKLLEQEGR
ncbi:MAG: lysophospholipid acyltransferase family protein [Negativicutes bacterium]|nr:lysophospholipid acyltransferase family protein [Negativicutes bacterium]